MHSKLDYCNFLYHNLPKCQITRLQQIQNSLARAVVKAPKSSHITRILQSLHWLKITDHTEYKVVSLTYKVLTTIQPSYLHNLITVQPPRSTRSSSLVTLAHPSIIFSTNNRSFLPLCFPVSGINSRLLSINHQLHPLTTLIIHHPFTLSFQVCKKLTYRRGTAQRAMSAKTVLNVAQMITELHLISPATGE